MMRTVIESVTESSGNVTRFCDGERVEWGSIMRFWDFSVMC